MLPVLAFDWTVSFGSMLAVLTVVSVGYGLYVTAKSGGPWRSTAEGTQRLLEMEQAKAIEMQKQTIVLQEKLATERMKTDVQPIARMVTQSNEQVAAIAIHVNELAENLTAYRDEMDKNKHDLSLVAQAVTTTLQELSILIRGLQHEVQDHTNAALTRHESIMRELRKMDLPGGAGV